MTVKVYVDVLFIINFIIDYILLSITSLFVKKKAKYRKNLPGKRPRGGLCGVCVFHSPGYVFYFYPFSSDIAFHGDNYIRRKKRRVSV